MPKSTHARRLRNTLCHEMCHAAAWLVNHVAKPPHGRIFKDWAALAMDKYPELSIATCHEYEINYKYKWRQCAPASMVCACTRACVLTTRQAASHAVPRWGGTANPSTRRDRKSNV